MNASTTMTIRVSDELKGKLDRLAYLAAEAVSAYVERELAIIEGVERGLGDVVAGRVTPHDEAMDRVDALISGARNPQA